MLSQIRTLIVYVFICGALLAMSAFFVLATLLEGPL